MRLYSQKDTKLLIDGFRVEGYMDGAPIKVTFDGGEIEKTEGTDGPGLNMATPQGGTIAFTIREDSDFYNYAVGLYEAQLATGGIVILNATLFSGSQLIMTLNDALITRPGELSTGDKKQGGVEFKIVGKAIGGIGKGGGAVSFL